MRIESCSDAKQASMPDSPYFDGVDETSTVFTSHGKVDPQSVVKIATNEAKDVRNMKVVMVLVLFVSICGALSVYFYTKNSEEEQFEEEYYDDAKKILQSIGQSIERSLGALDSLSTMIASMADSTNQTFPFVRVPEFGIHTAKILPLTKSTLIYFSPVVTFKERLEWESYAAKNNTELPKFVNESLVYQDNWSNFYGPMPQNYSWLSKDVIHSDFGDIPYNVSRPDGVDVHIPMWHTFPLVMTVYPPANWDFLSISDNSHHLRLLSSKKAVLQKPYMVPKSNNPEDLFVLELWCDFFRDYISPDDNCMEPMGSLMYPVLENLDTIETVKSALYPSKYEVKAEIKDEFYWRTKFRDILPRDSNGFVLVVDNTCGNGFTYQINGLSALYLGIGDRHDPKYNKMEVKSTLSNLNSYFEEESTYSGVPLENETCIYSFSVYPSDEMKDKYYTNKAIVFALSAASFIILPFLMFLVYDWKVTRQKKIILDTAEKSDAIISSLFPSHVHDQILSMGKSAGGLNEKIGGGRIADLYPNTTVLFADIANFTVWSSVRDPNQVFTLLETVYGAFDKRAEQRRVFKVETVGDCYVAVCGLPEPRKSHAVSMALFARDILLEMTSVTSTLETQLGPGTSTLAIRIGLNSGPTTAGVLRGTRGRYQLFGDTANTAARMEGHSLPGRILCSRKTADLIIEAGKEHWITVRNDLVGVKGKGMMQCYWCNPAATRSGNEEIPIARGVSDDVADVSEEKLIDWLVELFEEMLVEVISNHDYNDSQEQFNFVQEYTSPRDEVVETIVLPKASVLTKNISDEKLNPLIQSQLRSFVNGIVAMYQRNPFHNMEHAGHVIMATKKLLSRILKPKKSSASATAYGITSDPLTQFALVFAALIHDVDHPGVSNAQLVKEGLEVARLYNNKSVAEQHSITIAWNLLTSPEFNDLRLAIMPTASECQRFRQLIVNSVMATDLFDGDLKALREGRWNKAFQTQEKEQNKAEQDDDGDINRRATIVIEHIIQASDVSHIMQHWHVYQHWNRKLFEEMYLAYTSGRSEKDPSIGWYEGELWFFDNYIIPLAKKLKTCGVFGVSCDELLDYAIDNRAEWASKGKDIVSENVKSMYNVKSIKSIVGTALDCIMKDNDESMR